MAAAAQVRPLAGHGEIGNGRADESRGDNVTSTERGNGQAYLLRRLARDAPEILERVKAGEFRSARAAAIEAGIIRPVATVRLVDDPVWAQAQAQLQEAVKGKPGGNGPARRQGREHFQSEHHGGFHQLALQTSTPRATHHSVVQSRRTQPLAPTVAPRTASPA